MDKNAFAQDHHYTVTLREANDKLRPANLYVHLLADEYMIVRRTDGTRSGFLLKIKYDDVIRIVKQNNVPADKVFSIPQAMLNPKVWTDRDSIQTYSSGPGLGK